MKRSKLLKRLKRLNIRAASAIRATDAHSETAETKVPSAATKAA